MIGGAAAIKIKGWAKTTAVCNGHRGIIGSETDGHEEWEVRKQPCVSFSEDYGSYCIKK